MSELTKGFEKVFPLPWKMQRRGTWEYINAENGSGLGICIIPATDYEPKKAARQYLVQCANLMPEAVEVIRDLVKIVSQPDYDPDSLDYADYVVQRAKELLAKLEGGAEDERD